MNEEIKENINSTDEIEQLDEIEEEIRKESYEEI